MKKIMFSLVVIAATISLVSFAPKAKNADVVNFKVTAQKSKVDFTGSKKSDYHTGYFPIKSGAVQVNGGKLVGGNFVIDIAGLKVTDAGGGEKLQGHLTSADFFDIAKLGFGEASFTISSVEYTKADRATIKGDLNLKGIKAPVTFSADLTSNGLGAFSTITSSMESHCTVWRIDLSHSFGTCSTYR
jgi:polyisoprenoid-binding protein YceI